MLVFLRPPRIGKVKTRLAATLGDAAALRIYQFLLDHALRTASAIDAQTWLFLSEQDPFQASEPSWRFQVAHQLGGSLGDRMADAFSRTFERGAVHAVLIGTDVPELTADILDEAFHALEDCDMVIGPAEDGGYYLLGLKQCYVQLFEGIPWSTDRVFALTMQRAQALGLKVYTLPKLRDIDVESDWMEYLNRNPEIMRIFFPEKFV